MKKQSRKKITQAGILAENPAAAQGEVRYWGWGTVDRSFNPDKAEKFIQILANERGLPRAVTPLEPVGLDDFKMPAPDLPEAFVKAWSRRGLSLDRADRIIHACGKSYRDLVRVRLGKVDHYPDGVIHVRARDDLRDLLADAEKHDISLVPFGGGTGVVGGTECLGRKGQPVVVVDLKKLSRLLAFDEIAMTATFEAGILGPDLERILNEKGFTLGHFPQSFEYSTLGGWIATRSAGQNSTKYGKIEDRVCSLEMISPRGGLQTHNVPASATGPSLKQILIGSEGIYGIITAATVRVAPLPESQEFIQAFFPDFWEGMNAVRELVQAGLRPSILRLHDAEETDLFSKLSTHSTFEARLLGFWKTLHRLGNTPSFLLLAFEGDVDEVRTDLQRARIILRDNRGALMRRGMKETWKQERFVLPFLRDNLMDAGYFIDTLETAAPWSSLERLHHRMQEAFDPAKFGEKLIVGCHLSHAYTDGASLYFTFIGRQKLGHEISQWEKIKKRATDVIMENGGALSHHHGIGYDHSRWMKTEAGEMGMGIFVAIKKELDPAGCLNPGKLINT